MNVRTRLWLERRSIEQGQGFFLRDAETEQALRWDDPALAERGVWVLKVAGASHRLEALREDAFEPGRPLALVREPENPHDPNAIGIWDAERRFQAGYVPAVTAPRIPSPEELNAISLFEWWDRLHDRIGLRVLATRPDVWVGRPR